MAHGESDSDSALVNGRKAIQFGDRGTDSYFSMHARSSLAEVYFMLGDLEQANSLFEEAKTVERERHPRPPFLYSQGLFRYGYYLIETGRAADILNEAKNRDWGTNKEDSSLLSKAIRLLILGAAHRSIIEHGNQQPEFVAKAQGILDEGIGMFRTAGYSDYVVRGLLERAHFSWVRHKTEDYASALEDLDKATIEVKRGQMDLLYADVLLQRAACYLSFWATMTNPERSGIRVELWNTLDQATKLVESIGYSRRREMLDQLRSRAETVVGL